jgi:hypothetical protein
VRPKVQQHRQNVAVINQDFEEAGMSRSFRVKCEKQAISRLAAVLALLLGLGSPALAQIVTPNLTPPPCTSHCVNPNPGARVIPQGATQAQRGCPPGTEFNARKGTCRVLPPLQGTP